MIHGRRKVFAIGFNKSGTSSLHRLFIALGYRSYHGEKWRSCADMALLQSHDCFGDDIPQDLPKLDRLFPGSRFILQVRDLEPWLLSRLAHIQRARDEGRLRPHAEWDLTVAAVRAWVIKRNEWHTYVLDYFRERRSDLLIVNYIRDESAGTRVATFLGHEGAFPRPRENANPSRGRVPGHQGLVDECVQEMQIPAGELAMDLLCPTLLSSPDRNRYPADTAHLTW